MKDFTTYQKILKEITQLKDDDSFIFTKDMFDNSLKSITLHDLILRKSTRHISYDTNEKTPFEIEIKTDAVEWFSYKSVYLNFGVLLFDLLFSDAAYAEIKLNHKQSQIKTLFLYLDRQDDLIQNNVFLEIEQKQTYKSYEYISDVVQKFPFSSFDKVGVSEESVPSFYLGWSQFNSENNTKNANQLIIRLTIESLCKLAALFLNIGRNENTQDEICLEHPTTGFGGVGYNSIESKFWLPDSLGFYSENLDDLSFHD